MRKKQLQSLLALLLALLMVLSSTSALAAVKPGETISVTFCRDGSSYHSYQCTQE